MNYKVRNGVVLFSMCGEYFLFPSRSSGIALPFICTVPQELVCVLQGAKTDEGLGEDSCKKLQRWLRVGLIEEK